MRRILHIVGTMDLGGIEQFLMNIYRNIDREKVQFDFVVHSYEKNYFEDEIVSLGGKLYRIPRKNKNLLTNMIELYKLLSNHKEYQIIHIHNNSATSLTDLIIAKLIGVKVTIIHSHSTNTSLRKKRLHKIFRGTMKRLADYKFACSDLAADWLFGDRKNVHIIKNAIDTETFIFNKSVRDLYRKKFNIGDNTLVIGHIGSFSYAKNHDYLLSIMSEVASKEQDSKLILVGDGPNRKAIINKIKDLNLESHVTLAGLRNDVPKLLSVMDILVFPSFYEGFPVTLVEAQASGLKCIISDTISQEVVLTNLVERVSLENTPEFWAKLTVDNAKNYGRKNTYNQIVKCGYDVKNEALKLQNFYLNI